MIRGLGRVPSPSLFHMVTGITLFLFVKGTAADAVEELVSGAQRAAALDTLEKLRTLPEIGEMVVATAHREFAEQAAAMGAQVEMDGPRRFLSLGFEPGLPRNTGHHLRLEFEIDKLVLACLEYLHDEGPL